MLGKTISHYKVLEKIGQGGMGLVISFSGNKGRHTERRRIFFMNTLPKLVVLAITVNPFLLAQSDLGEAVERYNRAFRGKDVNTVRELLADDVLLFEHSVRNVGLEDVFENHLKPEITEFRDMTLEFADVRITADTNVALVTRQYKLQGIFRGRDVTASGNETMVWKKVSGTWKLAHIHYSHPCPEPAQSSE